MNWYLGVLQKYAEFAGRARRKEYWNFVLFNFLITIGLGIVDAILGTGSAGKGVGILGAIYGLGVLIPSLAVSVRRLHDIGRSGWWLLIGLVPLVGLIVLLVFAVQDSQEGSNAYGPNPKAAAA
jgi:uncharacterized membrane protein YhaH (DUF805 family)